MSKASLAIGAAALLGCAGSRPAPAAPAADAAPKPGLYAVLKTARGEVELRLFKDDAPKSVAAFVERGKAGGFDGAPFARAVPGAFVQAAARGGGGALPLELVAGRGFEKPGRVAVPLKDGAPVAGEFFVTLLPSPWLDGKHAVMGEVTGGLALLDAASREPRKERAEDGSFVDEPLSPLLIDSVRFEDRP